ncbi:MAG: ABC transporter substrate-binding protein [Planctomycetales bacterium]|nr:ABC transporter substrate-binding protein [Planctomycetales bacterium]
MIMRLSPSWAAATCLITTIGAAFHTTSPCVAEESLVLGALYNSSGSQAGLDIPSSQGARLAVSQANQNGGVLGRRVLLEIRDGESKAEVIAVKTSELLELTPAPVALFGLSDTDLVLAAAPLAARSKRVFLTSGATSPRLPAQVPEYLFLACFGDNVQASAAAEWAWKDRSASTALVLFDSSRTYTKLLQGYFQTRFKQLGGEVVAQRSFTSATLEQSIAELPDADVIFLAAEVPGDIQKAIRIIRDAGLSGPIIGGDSFDSEGLWRQRPDVDEVYFTTHAYLGEDNKNPRVIAFRKEYVEAFPDAAPVAFAALGYDAARLLMAAIKQANSAEPEDIRRTLAGIRRFEGVTGTMSYPQGSRIPMKSVSLIGVSGGTLRLVREILPKSAPAP